MAYLTVESHGLDDEFKATILQDYGVCVLDESEAPWTVIFEGPREGLVAMYVEHWGWEEGPDEQWLSETAPNLKD